MKMHRGQVHVLAFSRQIRTLYTWTGLLLFVVLFCIGGRSSQAQTSCFQLPSGAIAWWSFDETNGTTAADRVGNNTGAYANGPTPAPGEVRGALRFNGSNYVDVQDSDLWAFGTNDFSIELWVNFDQAPGGSIGEPGAIFIGNDEGPGSVNKWFFATGGGILNFHINSPTIGPKFFPLIPFSPVVGQWYHLAVVRNGSTYTIYTNGVPAGSAVDTDVIPNPNAPLTIGEAEQIGFMHGRLDEVTVYGRALAATELLGIYNAGSAGKCINLAINPTKGGDNGIVSVRINGSGFEQGATAQLAMAGQTNIVGSPVTVGSDGTTIDTTFDLHGQADGAWDVVITNPDNSGFTIPGGFTIEPGTGAQVWVDIVGLNLIRPGRAQTFHVFYGNSGDVDAVGVPLWIAGIPTNAVVTLGFDVLPPVPMDSGSVDISQVPVSINTGTETVIPLRMSTIPAGSSGALAITVTIPTSENFLLRAWANPPLFGSPADQDILNCYLGIAGQIAGQIIKDSCAVTWSVTLHKVLLELGPGKPVNWTWDILNLGFQCAPAFACQLCVEAKLTPACVVCVASKVAQFGAEVYSDYNDITACEKAASHTSENSSEITSVDSFDPNDKAGSQGVGAPKYISGQKPIPYSIFFANEGTATAPAQQVVITDQLDPTNMDLSTFSLGPIAFGTNLVTPSSGLSAFTTNVDLRPGTNIIVRIVASLDPNTALLTWQFTSIDPATGNPPIDPTVGFLPPDVTPPQGDGSVLYTVMPKKGLPTGTVITNGATIVFDANPPIPTGVWTNTLDTTKPQSMVLPIMATPCSTNLSVQWSGTDVGSGISTYTIFASDNGGTVTPWQSNTTNTSGMFGGQFGHTYAFYSTAQDQVGNAEDPHASPDATASIDIPSPPTISCPAPVTVQCAAKVPLPDTSSVTDTGDCSGIIVTFVGDMITNQTCANRYTIARTYRAVDSLSNTATCTQTITVNLTIPPALACPANVTVATDAGKCYATSVALGTPTASDNCGGNVTVVNNAPTQFPTGANPVIWTATDSCGNSATCTQTVFVVDNQPPTIACPANIVTSAPPSAVSVAVNFPVPQAGDNCSVASVTCAPAPGASFPVGTNVVICTATDTSGNTTNCYFHVIVGSVSVQTCSIDDLISRVKGLNIRWPGQNHLLWKLQWAKLLLQNGQTWAASAELEDFIWRVGQLEARNLLDPNTANSLISCARSLEHLRSPPPPCHDADDDHWEWPKR